ncbi:MAG: DNA translocase FtsK [Anaerolineales bacterium]|nr:DNA translocase FtsK [Anaerolineales bacterium]
MLSYLPFFNLKTNLTPDEIEQRDRARAEAKYHRELQKRLKQEATYLQKKIPHYLANMDICYRKKKNEKDFFESDVWPVKLDKIQIGEDAYFFHIDTKRLPRGVYLHHIKDEKTLETLTAACGSKVEYHETETGYWLSVETKHGRGAIPTQVGYGEMISQMAEAADPLSFPMGMGANQKAYFGDMDELINFLVGGTKGGGKSNLINVILCTLISRNDPAKLRLFLTDLKGGLEFIDYAGLPHLGGDVPYIEHTHGEGEKATTSYKVVDLLYTPKENEVLAPPMGQQIATDPHQVLPVLKYCEAEMDRRAKLMAGKAKKISAYNKRFKSEPLSHWIVVIDELATLMENGKYKLKATLSLSELARKGRAVGIYIVLATQTPSSAIVPQQIANNMDSRAAFRCGSGTASGILLGDGKYEACKLPNIPGRFLWKWGGEMIEIQAPFIADTTVKKIVADAKQGSNTDAQSAERAQKAEFLFSFALGTLKGECHTKTLHKFLKPHGFTEREVAGILSDFEVKGTPPGLEPEIEINGDTYYLAPAQIARRVPRWLVPAGDFLAGKHPHPEFISLGDLSVSRVACRTESPIPVDPENSKPSKVDGSKNENELQTDEVIAEELENEWFEEIWETPDEVEPLEPELAKTMEEPKPKTPAKAKRQNTEQPEPADDDDLPDWLRD